MIGFEAPVMFHLLWIVPVLGMLFAYADGRRRSATNQFGGRTFLVSRRRNHLLLAMSFVSAVIALARPTLRGAAELPPERGADVVFLLDISRSMLADDVQPTRLDQAKLTIRDLLDRVRGQRVALVAYAGVPSIECPLTADQAFLRARLDDVNPDSAAMGGSVPGKAIEAAVRQVFDDVERDSRTIVLVGDGDDHAGSSVKAAQEAASRGVRIITVGVGDAVEGAKVPDREVVSKLDERKLRAIADATAGGFYAGSTFETERIESAIRSGPATRPQEQRIPLFQFFAAACLMLLVAEWFTPPRLAVVASILLVVGCRPQRESAGMLFDAGAQLYAKEDYWRASQAFKQASELAADDRMVARSRYNAANATYRNALPRPPAEALSLVEQAIKLYHDTLDVDPSFEDARFNMEIAKRRMAVLRTTASAMRPPVQPDMDRDARDILDAERNRKPEVQSFRPAVEKDW